MRHIALLGFGATNQAILATTPNAIFDVFDDKFAKVIKSKNAFGNAYTMYPKEDYKTCFETKHYDHSIVTPGMPPSHELVRHAISYHQNLISEYDFFEDRMPFVVWISGTNGKTTLTQMLQHLLGDGISAMGANVGLPVAQMEPKPVWILETSSFACHYTNTCAPNLYALLPINDDHLSWHGDFKAYEASKLKAIGMMGKQDIAILPSTYKGISTKAHAIFYETTQDVADAFGIDMQKVKSPKPFDLTAALALGMQKIITGRFNIDHLNTFKLDSYKVEPVYDRQGRLWIDDTKATNISACIAAVNAFNAYFLRLILGGDSKGVSLRPLFEQLENLRRLETIHLYAVGKAQDEVMALSQEFGIQATLSQSVVQAVSDINTHLQEGDLGILSPACASLDQFKNYKARGDAFKEAVKGL